MLEQLVERGVPLPRIREVMPDRALRVLPGKIADPEAVRAALSFADPNVEVGRWFCDHPLIDESAGETYVLFKMWGLNTEPTLASLAAAFPEAKVSFRSARAPTMRSATAGGAN